MRQPPLKHTIDNANTSPTAPVAGPFDEKRGWLKGVLLTLVVAVLASNLVQVPLVSIMGVLVVSLLVGLGWRSLLDVPADAGSGIAFSSKILLRAGIILMGLRLNVSQIAAAGMSIVLTDLIVVAFTLLVMLGLASLFRVDRQQSILLAVGTAICGAAAIAAIAPLIRAKQETTAVTVACIAILGTVGTLLYILLYPLLGLAPADYGRFAGATLHELAHVIAAAAPGGAEAAEMAILVKLGRVALLIPIALLFRWLLCSEKTAARSAKSVATKWPIPWFILGFLLMSLVRTVDLLPANVVQALINLSVFLLAMAMAGLGLSIKASDLRRLGLRGALTSVLGYTALVCLGALLLAFV